jgi:nucleoside-diphosphate-sugar epimerase
MKKILVTGAGGYIGSVLVPYLLKKKYKVLAVDRFFFGNFLKKNKNLSCLYQDIRTIDKKYFKKIYAVIDLAAISNDPSGENFSKETYEINHIARFRNAKLAKKQGVEKYLLPSTCSNYGKVKGNKIANEESELNPLTHYAKANSRAEKDIIKLASNKFCVTIFRQSTLFGYSPRLRLDLAINGMTYGIFKNNVLPVMRDGTQKRPMLHIKDAARAMEFFLKKDNKIINKQIFNIGDNLANYSIIELVKEFKFIFKNKFKIKWYGTPDQRSYSVSFDKINKIGFKTKYNAEYGILELINKFNKNKIEKKSINITLEWYKELEDMNNIIKNCSINNKILKL